MLANPAGVIVAGIAAIAAAYLLLRGRVSEVKSETELLAEAEKNVKDSYADQMAQLLPLVEAVKEGNLTQKETPGYL